MAILDEVVISTAKDPSFGQGYWVGKKYVKPCFEDPHLNLFCGHLTYLRISPEVWGQIKDVAEEIELQDHKGGHAYTISITDAKKYGEEWKQKFSWVNGYFWRIPTRYWTRTSLERLPT